MSRSVFANCRDCGRRRRVLLVELDRAAQPRCLVCGGFLDLSEDARRKLAEVHDRQEGQIPTPPPRKKEPAPARLIPDKPLAKFEWWDWPDMYRWVVRDFRKRGQDLSIMTWQQFYDSKCAGAMGSDPTDEDLIGSGMITECERELYRSGRPYYKVFPAITGALMHTDMRVTGQYFHLPYPALELRFPKTDNPLAPLGTALVARIDGSAYTDGREWGLAVIVFDNVAGFWDRDDAGHYWVADIPIRPGLLLEDALDQTALMKQSPNSSLMRQLVRVAVGVGFFGTDRHELILPDLPRKVIERYQKEGRQPNSSEAQKELRQAKEAGLFGFKVGSEIDLPLARVTILDPRERQGTGERELAFSHIRRGHLKMQPCGKERKERKIIFVAPTIVRPDLPLVSTHGYRLRVPKGLDWQPTME